MKKLFIAFALSSALYSCKKEATNTNSTTNSSNGVTCVENPNINFTSIGTPVGKFSDCIKDIDGNVYKTVTIGTQTWMAENLKVSKYNDGTSIKNIIDNTLWNNDTSGAWAYYNNDAANNAKYGKLYNWYAVSKTTNGNKNVCPTGWHVPTDAEWSNLIDFLGGEKVACGKMKAVGISNWKGSTNSSLFTGLPSARRSLDGTFRFIDTVCVWLSSSESSLNDCLVRFINSGVDNVYRDNGSKNNGASVRCIRD